MRKPAAWRRSTPAGFVNSSADGLSAGRPGRPSSAFRHRVTADYDRVVLVPDDLRYTADHEWIKVDGEVARLGITDFAQDALGDVVYVQLPTIGTAVTAGQSFAEVESTKSVSDIYAPLTGTITAVNEALADTPEALNTDPYGNGWMCEISLTNPAEVEALLDAAAYIALTGE